MADGIGGNMVPPSDGDHCSIRAEGMEGVIVALSVLCVVSFMVSGNVVTYTATPVKVP